MIISEEKVARGVAVAQEDMYHDHRHIRRSMTIDRSRDCVVLTKSPIKSSDLSQTSCVALPASCDIEENCGVAENAIGLAFTTIKSDNNGPTRPQSMRKSSLVCFKKPVLTL